MFEYNKHLAEKLLPSKMTWVAEQIGNGLYETEDDFSQEVNRLKEKYDYLMNPENMSNHSPIYKDEDLHSEIDLTDCLKKIAYSTSEKFMVIVHDPYKNEIKECKIVATGTSKDINSPKINLSIIDYLRKYTDETEIPNLIFVHNHPSSVVAIPSNEDLKYFEALKTVCRFIGVHYAASIIVSNFDIWNENK